MKYLKTKDFIMFAEAWICLAKARWMLLFRPFRTIMPVMQRKTAGHSLPGDDELKRIQLAITRASTRSPWRTRCFEQALTAKMMTSRRGIATDIYFGVSKEEGGNVKAHAWVKHNDFIITGWRRMEEYTEIARF